MGRKSIVIASLLKPVDDTRMFEKLGLSMSQTNKYDINIIGFYSKNIKKVSGIRFYPVFRFKRLSFQRILAPLKLLVLLFKLNPKVIIINSHDLLIVTSIYSSVTGSYFIYDLQENYFRNILHNSHWPLLLKYMLAYYVRMKEWIAHLFIDTYFLAEKGYYKEMSRVRGKYIVLENKYAEVYPVKKMPRDDKKLILVYTGTISETYGIFDCINFVDKLHALDNRIRFRITGYCAHAGSLLKLKHIIKQRPYIRLQGGDRLMPHETIIREIRNADFGIINYRLNKAFTNCFPTRLYEYTALELPVLVQDYEPWAKYCLTHNAGLVVDFGNPEYRDLLRKMNNTEFYPSGAPHGAFWQSEEKKLLSFLNEI